jgi:virginiamycin A acetyltransferase
MERHGATTIHKDAWVAAQAVLEEPVHVSARACIYGSARVGRYTFVNVDCVLYPQSSCGRFTSLGRCVELGAAKHPVDWLSTHLFQLTDSTFSRDPAYAAIRRTKAERLHPPTVIDHDCWIGALHPPTMIGHDCWIGAKSVVRAGVRIGDGAVVGAGAVVTRDIPPYAIAVGSPARVVRSRFSDATVARLLALRWWELPLEDLVDVPFADVLRAIELLEERASERRGLAQNGTAIEDGA